MPIDPYRWSHWMVSPIWMTNGWFVWALGPDTEHFDGVPLGEDCREAGRRWILSAIDEWILTIERAFGASDLLEED